MDVDLARVVDADGWSACEPLFARYVEWVVGELAARGVPTAPDQARRVAEGFALERDALLCGRGRLYLARAGTAPVGVVALTPTDATVAEVKRLYVEPAARGLGVASSLMERVIEDARELGTTRLRLETHAYMAGARALYERLGFAVSAPFAGFEGEGFDLAGLTVFYSLDVAAPPGS